MKYALSAFLILAITAITAKLALAPFHDVYTADECRAAYARARTHAETIAVDFTPFDDHDNSVDTRCSSVRYVRALSAADLLGR